jgi:ankyrin repeat protein
MHGWRASGAPIIGPMPPFDLLAPRLPRRAVLRGAIGLGLAAPHAARAKAPAKAASKAPAAAKPPPPAPLSPQDQQLLAAARAGDARAVRRALDAGAAIEARDADGRTPVLLATLARHVPTVRLLIDRGANVNAQDRQRDSAFLLASAQGLTEIVRATLGAGADVASTNRYGGTGLIPACERGHLETVRLLLSTPIDVNHVNDLGWTALLETVVLGDGGATYVQIARLLLARGAQVNLADREGVTPLRHAERRGQRRVADLLRAAGGK